MSGQEHIPGDIRQRYAEADVPDNGEHPEGKSFNDIIAQKDRERTKWAEIREARQHERKYPYNPMVPEGWRERLKRHAYLFFRGDESLRERFHQRVWETPVSHLRHKRQRMSRGWSSADSWNFDTFLARMIAEVARQFRDEGHGFPTWAETDAEGNTLSEGEAVKLWNEILTEISDGFGGYAAERYDSDSQQFKRAMELFVKWFPALWD